MSHAVKNTHKHTHTRPHTLSVSISHKYTHTHTHTHLLTHNCTPVHQTLQQSPLRAGKWTHAVRALEINYPTTTTTRDNAGGGGGDSDESNIEEFLPPPSSLPRHTTPLPLCASPDSAEDRGEERSIGEEAGGEQNDIEVMISGGEEGLLGGRGRGGTPSWRSAVTTSAKRAVNATMSRFSRAPAARAHTHARARARTHTRNHVAHSAVRNRYPCVSTCSGTHH